MNGALLLGIGLVLFILAYFTYGRYLTRMFGIDPERRTPAHTRKDGIDYVPTRLPVLFGHHFSSIAGAGPIVGPIAAVYFGWIPVALWIIIGCILVGSLHDFAALFFSVRNEGKSIGYIIEKHIGYSGRQIFLLFCWAALVLVVAVFAIHVAKTFVNTPSVATASLCFIAIAPVFGWLVYKKNVSLLVASCIFVPLMFFFIFLGNIYKCDLTAIFGVTAEQTYNIWLVVLFIYVFVASVIPVWMLLQPRDYLNSYLLYAMMILGFLGIMFAAPGLKYVGFAGLSVKKGDAVSGLFPILFVTVACGACSGFHALVSSGTTSKQLDSEKHILPIGYGSMLVEGVLALMALIGVAYLNVADASEMISQNGAVVSFASGMAFFCEKLGVSFELGRDFFSLAISAFLLTTLDTATRLTRYAWQELFQPRFDEGRKSDGTAGFLENRYVATLIAVVATGYLAFSGDSSVIWPVFGASNQLLAALTLLVVSLILIKAKKNFWITLVPMFLMLVMCVWALCDLLRNNLHAENVNIALAVATAFLLIMAVVLVVQALVALKKAKGSDIPA